MGLLYLFLCSDLVFFCVFCHWGFACVCLCLSLALRICAIAVCYHRLLSRNGLELVAEIRIRVPLYTRCLTLFPGPHALFWTFCCRVA